MAQTRDELVDAVLALIHNARRELRASGPLAKTTIDQRDRIRLEVYYQISGHVEEFDLTP